MPFTNRMLSRAVSLLEFGGNRCIPRRNTGIYPSWKRSIMPMLPLNWDSSVTRAVACSTSQQEPGMTVAQLLSGGARLTQAAHAAWKGFLEEGDLVVDATAGNGFDTVFLAQHVGPSGRIVAVDIQAEALEATKKNVASEILAHNMPEISYVHGCHSRLQEYVEAESAKLVCFNLGYYPSGDRSIVSEASTTVAGMRAACKAVAKRGIVSVLAYVGHPGGLEEYEAVRALASDLATSEWITSEHRLLNRPTSPILILFYKRN